MTTNNAEALRDARDTLRLLKREYKRLQAPSIVSALNAAIKALTPAPAAMDALREVSTEMRRLAQECHDCGQDVHANTYYHCAGMVERIIEDWCGCQHIASAPADTGRGNVFDHPCKPPHDETPLSEAAQTAAREADAALAAHHGAPAVDEALAEALDEYGRKNVMARHVVETARKVVAALTPAPDTATPAAMDALRPLYELIEKWTQDAHRLCSVDADGDSPTEGDYGVARGLYACADMLKDAAARLTPQVAQPEAWQPIETAPDDGTLIFVSDGAHRALAHKSFGGWVQFLSGTPILFQPSLQWHPTLWTPAPTKPASPTQDAAHGVRE